MRTNKTVNAVLEDGTAIEVRYGEWKGLELDIVELDCGNGLACYHQFAPISLLKNLKKLILNASDVDNLYFLENLKKLEYLECVVNSIKDLTPLANLVSLKQLDLADNLIEDITPLENLINLEELCVEDNSIKSLAPVAKLKNLKVISFLFQRPYIKDLTPLKDLKSLEIIVMPEKFFSNTAVSYHEIKTVADKHKNIKGLIKDNNCIL